MNEDQANRQRQLDEAVTQATDLFPPMWRSLHDKCRSEGFSDSESLQLVKAYILSQCPYGIRGTDA